MFSFVARVLFVAVCAVVAGVAFAASTGSGEFTYDGAKMVVKNAYALRVHKKDSMGALYVLLTDKPIDIAAVAAKDDPDFALMDLKDVDYIRLCVTAEGRSCGFFSASSGFNTSGVGEFKLTTNTPTRIEGSWIMDKPGDFFGKKYQFKLNWAADIVDAKK
jgi:hypothetical protein